MFDQILVVCTGNICRSPFGEAVLKQLCPEKNITSAGTGALVGYPADSTAIRVAEQMNVNLSQHKARQLTKNICSENDLILVMESHHRQYISSIAPEATGKSMLFGQWLNEKTINDPYRRSEEYFKLVFEEIKKAAITWKTKL